MLRTSKVKKINRINKVKKIGRNIMIKLKSNKKWMRRKSKVMIPVKMIVMMVPERRKRRIGTKVGPRAHIRSISIRGFAKRTGRRIRTGRKTRIERKTKVGREVEVAMAKRRTRIEKETEITKTRKGEIDSKENL